MRKLTLTGVTGLGLVAVVAGLILAAPAAGSTARTATKLVVAMHDPGCHWFLVGGTSHPTYAKTVTRQGPVKLVNFDENTLIIKGPTGTKRDNVGATVLLTAKGLYRVTMVKQASDDNHLKLTLK
jgi:hypothetical protein